MNCFSYRTHDGVESWNEVRCMACQRARINSALSFLASRLTLTTKSDGIAANPHWYTLAIAFTQCVEFFKAIDLNLKDSWAINIHYCGLLSEKFLLLPLSVWQIRFSIKMYLTVFLLFSSSARYKQTQSKKAFLDRNNISLYVKYPFSGSGTITVSQCCPWQSCQPEI